MQIPELNIISDFEAGMNCLQNPSLLSRFFSLSGIQVYSIWKWGALILALVGIITRVKLLFFRFYKSKVLASSGSPALELDGEFELDEDESSSSASSDEEEYEPRKQIEGTEPVEEDFCVAGSSFCRDDWRREGRDLRFRRGRSCVGDRFSWSDLANPRSVVKLWDSLGLGFDFEEDSSESVVSVWDLNKDLKTNSYTSQRCQIPAVGMSSRAVILSAGSSNKNVLFGVYDTRVPSQTPAIYAEWEPQCETVLGVDSGGVEKVYVRDGITASVTVGDMRNVKAPLDNLTEVDGDTWWDVDAVIVSDELVDDSR
ncbi:hypothetical protein NMG60_11020498 [Bertholletia excelsa]